MFPFVRGLQVSSQLITRSLLTGPGTLNRSLFLFLSDQSSEVKLGNPLLVLLQTPFQLLSHLIFDRQVSPDRYVL